MIEEISPAQARELLARAFDEIRELAAKVRDARSSDEAYQYSRELRAKAQEVEELAARLSRQYPGLMATAELLSPQELAARSNGQLSVATVRRHLAAGRGGPGVIRTPGGWFRAPAEALERLLRPVAPQFKNPDAGNTES